MNYLHHASKHISSSHSFSNNKKKPIGITAVVILVVVLVIGYMIFGGLVGNMLFGIKNWFAPSTENGVSLLSTAYDGKVSALEVENDSLKQLLIKAGITLPDGAEPEDEGTMFAKQGGVASSTEEKDLGTSTATTSDMFEGEDSITATGEMASVPTDNKLELKGNEVLASVLVRPPQTPYDALVVNVGTASGISVGDQVYAFSGFPIGEVVATEKSRSTVRLLSAPGSKVDVLIGTSTIAVTAEGKGGGNFFLKLPKVTEIKEGDSVVRNYLPPEVLGTIESVESEDGEAYIYAYFKLPIRLNSLVYVLIKKTSPQL